MRLRLRLGFDEVYGVDILGDGIARQQRRVSVEGGRLLLEWLLLEWLPGLLVECVLMIELAIRARQLRQLRL